MAGRTFLMDGQAISHDAQYSSDDGEKEQEDEGEDEEEMEYNHYGTEQQYDDEDDGSKEYDIMEEENAPSMPVNFYSDVDNFLSRPPPAVSLKGPKKKKKGSSNEQGRGKPASSLPVIDDMSHVQSKVSSRRVGVGGKKGKGKAGGHHVLDERLLQQAFEYTNKLQQEAMVEEVYEASMNMQAQKSSSAPQLHQKQLQQQHAYQGDSQHRGNTKPRSADTDIQHAAASSNRPRKDGKKKPANGVVRRLRSKTQTSVNQGGGKPPRSKANMNDFDTSTNAECATSTRNITDFDSLVANFEQGTHLKQLREELEQSQASMAESRRAMQGISKEMAGKLRI